MRPWLGTFVEVQASGPEERSLTTAVESAFAAVRRVHELMSFHDSSSDIARLNRSTDAQPVPVDGWTWTVLDEALRMSRLSQGLFDITTAATLVKTGFLPAQGGRSHADGHGCWRDIELLSGNRVRLHRPLLIDLGGIAKGFAVDQAVAALRAGGASHGLVNAGGDLRVFGDQPQSIHLRNPSAPQQLTEIITLQDEALATSAPYFSAVRRGRRLSSALIDPRSGSSCVRQVSVSVRARECLLADALTKIVLADTNVGRAALAACGAHAWVVEAAPRPHTPMRRRAPPLSRQRRNAAQARG